LFSIGVVHGGATAEVRDLKLDLHHGRKIRAPRGKNLSETIEADSDLLIERKIAADPLIVFGKNPFQKKKVRLTGSRAKSTDVIASLTLLFARGTRPRNLGCRFGVGVDALG
jgi:hypothetical protein